MNMEFYTRLSEQATAIEQTLTALGHNVSPNGIEMGENGWHVMLIVDGTPYTVWLDSFMPDMIVHHANQVHSGFIVYPLRNSGE